MALWQSKQIRAEQGLHAQGLPGGSGNLSAFARGTDPASLNRRRRHSNDPYADAAQRSQQRAARKKATVVSREAEKMRYHVGKARREARREGKEREKELAQMRERVAQRGKLPAVRRGAGSPFNKSKLPGIKAGKKSAVEAAEWARQQREKQREDEFMGQDEHEEELKKVAEKRNTGGFTPSVMKSRRERSDSENRLFEKNLKLPQHWLAADKRAARKAELAKLPFYERWCIVRTCCCCLLGRKKRVHADDGKKKHRRHKHRKPDGEDD
eukprot:g4990.t1